MQSNSEQTPKGRAKRVKKEQKVSGFTKTRFVKNMIIIAVLIVGGACAAHFGLRLATRQSARCVVPNLMGLSLSEANSLADQRDLRIIINDSLHAPAVAGGTVLDQLPVGGVEVKPGRKVYIVINAFNAQKVDIPYVAGRSLRQAKNMLEVAGLQIARLEYHADMATNYVLAEYYGKREITEGSAVKVPVGTGITLHVGRSEDDPTTVVPRIVGLSLSAAKSRLWEMGLNIGEIKMEKGVTPQNQADARVLLQSVMNGSEVTLGESVSFTLSLDDKKVNKTLIDIRKAEALRIKMEREAKEKAEDSI